MNRSKLPRKLNLAKETLKDLGQQNLTTVAGAGPSFLGACSRNTICWSCGPSLCPSLPGYLCPAE